MQPAFWALSAAGFDAKLLRLQWKKACQWCTGGSSLPGETKNDQQGPIGAVEMNKLVWGQLMQPRQTHIRAQKCVAGSHQADHFEAENGC